MKPGTIEKIDQIAEARGGLTAIWVLELAVDDLHLKVCGRKATMIIDGAATMAGSGGGRRR